MKNICVTIIEVILLLILTIFTTTVCVILGLIAMPLLHIKICVNLIKNRLKDPTSTVKDAAKQSEFKIKWFKSTINFKNGD